MSENDENEESFEDTNGLVSIPSGEYEQLKKIEELWNELDPFVVQFAKRFGQPMRVIRRDMKDVVGAFIGCTFEVKEFKIYTETTEKVYIDKTIIHENKVSVIPTGSVFMYDWLLDRRIDPDPEAR